MQKSILYTITRPIISFLFKLFYHPVIVGENFIPKKGRIILAGNHTNNLDCILLMSSTKRNIHFLAKDELWKGPKKIIFKNMGLIPVNRKAHNPKAVELAEEYLNNEKIVGIFPEGTFPKNGELLLPFKTGAVRMAHDTNTKIVPFVITGKYHIFSKSIQIKFLEPINIKSSCLVAENEKLRNIIKDKLEEKICQF